MCAVILLLLKIQHLGPPHPNWKDTVLEVQQCTPSEEWGGDWGCTKSPLTQIVKNREGKKAKALPILLWVPGSIFDYFKQ